VVQVVVGRWGNNLAVRLPGEIVEAIKLRDGERVEIEADGEEIVIRRVKPRASLADMFRGKSPEAWRAEYSEAYNWGPDIGSEVVPE
jgi:antitoxin MazE